MDNEQDPVQEAMRLKAIAETKFKNSNIKSALKHVKKAQQLAPTLDGLSSMLTAFRILRAASKSSETPDWYKTLQVEPFSHINTIKKQYKKLALVLHPDKNPHLGCEEAFKLLGEGFRVLSDKIRRKEYDMKLRIRMQDERVRGLVSEVQTFWTACSRCRLLHQFQRKYLGHNLVCPGCKKSFVAVEVEGGSGKAGDCAGNASASAGDDGFEDSSLREFMGKLGLKRKMDIGKVDGGRLESIALRKKVDSQRSGELKQRVDGDGASAELGKEVGGHEWGGGRLRSRGLRQRTSTVGEVLARSKENRLEHGQVQEQPKLKRAEFGEEMMTLAEMQLKIKQRVIQQKEIFKKKEKNEGEKGKEEKHGTLKGIEQHGTSNKSRELKVEKSRISKRGVNMGIETGGAGMNAEALQPAKHAIPKKKTMDLEIEKHLGFESEELEIMAVEDADFYDFDKDRMEKSFKKGQVWAVYDDDDGMPRHYALADEVVSLNPFELKLSWLDLINNGDQDLICWEKMGFHVSCGSFKVGKKASINSINIFSHVVECERAAREIYRIYPKKGSVWALYNEASLGAEGRNISTRDRRCYDIVVFLTTYSEMHGLSMAYLEKVEGFKTVFKRAEIGCHAIRWLEKDDVQLFSHQIPARKLSGDQISDDLKDCWELDPASLPSDLLTICRGR